MLRSAATSKANEQKVTPVDAEAKNRFKVYPLQRGTLSVRPAPPREIA
jgi:hypothetical protein